MKRKIILTTTALVFTAGSILALSNRAEEKTTERTVTEQCPPDCCMENSETCTPPNCGS